VKRSTLLVCLLVLACGAEGPATDLGEMAESAEPPPPVPYRASALRRLARERGVFEGLPPARLGELEALVAALRRERSATGSGGEGGPTRAELRVAELGERIAEVARRHSAEELRETFRGIPERIRFRTFTVLTVKDEDGGYRQRVEPRETEIAFPGP
jgi:hypothetical protein